MHQKPRKVQLKSDLEANISELKRDLNKVAGSLSRIRIKRIADVQDREQKLESILTCPFLSPIHNWRFSVVLMMVEVGRRSRAMARLPSKNSLNSMGVR